MIKKNQKTTFPGREEKETRLGQRACVIWLTGLSGSGKSTIARQLEVELTKNGFLTQAFDGDIIRTGINSDLGFSEKDRTENIRRIAEINKLFLNCGIICINSLISPTHAIRKMAYDIIGRDNVIEVFVNASLETCEQRDTKGLYKKARAGLIKEFTGISSPYEPPETPDILLNTEKMTVEECVAVCVEAVNKLEAGREKEVGSKLEARSSKGKRSRLEAGSSKENISKVEERRKKSFGFKELIVWQKAVDFADLIISITNNLDTKEKHYRLQEQIEAAAASVACNIAEGKGRNSKKEFIQYLYIARGSLYETITLATVFHNRKWISNENYLKIEKSSFEIASMIKGLINSISK